MPNIITNPSQSNSEEPLFSLFYCFRFLLTVKFEFREAFYISTTNRATDFEIV